MYWKRKLYDTGVIMQNNTQKSIEGDGGEEKEIGHRYIALFSFALQNLYEFYDVSD